MADDQKSMSQDDIDALISQIAGDAPAAPAPAKPAAPAPAPDNGMLDQDAIDALMDAASQAPAATAPTAASAPAAKPPDNGMLDQSAIDALMDEMNLAPAAPTAVAAALTRAVANAAKNPPPAENASGGNLGQDDIDKMLADLAGPVTGQTKTAAPIINQAKVPTAAAPTTAKPGSVSKTQQPTVDEGPLGQDDIDKLLSELGAAQSTKNIPVSKPVAKAPEKAPEKIAQSIPTTSVVDAARSQKPGTSSSAPKVAGKTQAADPNATIVADLNATTAVPFPNAANAPTLALSTEDLDALVDKQSGNTSEHREAPMIDQNDIDALVKQLAVATGAPDTQKISDALAKHEGEIDKLLEKAGDPKLTVDAITAPNLLGASTSANKRPTVAMTVPVMAPSELKGTRYLLAAAVLFLAMCATTLGMVVGAIQSLAHELKEQHQAQLVPTNSFTDDYKAALAQLNAPDDGIAAKGALFLQRLKKNYPSHEGEIALALARYYRSTGALRQAVEEYSGLAEINLGRFDDPRLYLDYAACLAELNDVPAATRQVYKLLANEKNYIGARDQHGLTRPADEIARNQQALQDAYLTLGRLLSEPSGGHNAVATLSKNDTYKGSGESHHQPADGPAHESVHENADKTAAEATSEPATPAAGHGGH